MVAINNHKTSAARTAQIQPSVHQPAVRMSSASPGAKHSRWSGTWRRVSSQGALEPRGAANNCVSPSPAMSGLGAATTNHKAQFAQQSPPITVLCRGPQSSPSPPGPLQALPQRNRLTDSSPPTFSSLLPVFRHIWLDTDTARCAQSLPSSGQGAACLFLSFFPLPRPLFPSFSSLCLLTQLALLGGSEAPASSTCRNP